MFPAPGPGSLTFNDTDADANDTLRVVAVTPPAHGTAVLNADGSVTYTPAAQLHRARRLHLHRQRWPADRERHGDDRRALGNMAPVANNDFYTVNEDTTLIVPAPPACSRTIPTSRTIR